MMEELSFHIVDIVQNSVAAGASRIDVRIFESEREDLLRISIIDNGSGMNEQTVQNVQDPFYTTKSYKKVGLGVPLFKETALHCDGGFVIDSEPGRGTDITASFRKSHIDLPPMGNLSDTVLCSIVGSENVNIVFEIKQDSDEFVISTDDIREQVGDVSLSHPEIYAFLRDYINENLMNLGY